MYSIDKVETSNSFKVDATYPDLPSRSLQDIDRTHSGTSESSSHTHSATPLNPVADDVQTNNFWAATRDSPDAVFAQVSSGTQWTPSFHTEYPEAGGSTSNRVRADDTTDSYTKDYSPNTHSTHSFTSNQHYKIDHLAMPYETPPFETAHRLIRHFKTVHDWIPIVPTAFLEREAGQYCVVPVPVSNTWLTMLHLVFAIGARHACLTDRSRSRETDGEIVQYFSRAMMTLGMSESATVMGVPDLGLVQCYGLLSLYHLTGGQIDR